MNPIYFSFPLIAIEISLFFTKDSVQLQYYGINISIPINKTLIIILIISNILVTLWSYKHINDNKLYQHCNINFRNKIKKYLISINATKSQNLIDTIGDVFKNEKDIYYINGYAIIKTSEGYNDKEKYCAGYFKKMHVMQYQFLIAIGTIISILDMEFFINCMCIFFLVLFIPFLITKVIT